jgi:signal transduction histidine kinase
MASRTDMFKRFLAKPERLFWVLQVIGWLCYCALNYIAAIGYGKPTDYIRVSAASAVAGFIITSFLRYGLRAVWGWPTSRLVPAALVLLFVATVIYSRFHAEALFRWCDECRPMSLMGYIGYFGSVLYVMLSWAGLYFGIKFTRAIAHERETALKATAAAHEAQLRMLRYQLNPHFLFNTLNAISTLILDNKNATANRMVGGLSAFLRHSLDSDPMQRVTLQDEIDALQRYLGIEQLRFGERLRVEIDVTSEARSALVPSLILQPLIENCIKYAIARRIEGGLVAIRAKVEGECLTVRVQDDGPGMPVPCDPTGTGVGLANTRERLRVLYGERQHVRVDNRPGGGVEVALSLPFEPAPP